MRKTLVASLSAILLAIPVQAADEVKIEQADLDGVLKAVAAHKGKVVVVDVWGTF